MEASDTEGPEPHIFGCRGDPHVTGHEFTHAVHAIPRSVIPSDREGPCTLRLVEGNGD